MALGINATYPWTLETWELLRRTIDRHNNWDSGEEDLAVAVLHTLSQAGLLRRYPLCICGHVQTIHRENGECLEREMPRQGEWVSRRCFCTQFRSTSE